MVKVTSAELSKNLSDAGADQSAEFYWSNLKKAPDAKPVLERLDRITLGLPEWDDYAAFDCAELLERITWKIEIGEAFYSFGLHKIGDRFWANYDHADRYREDQSELAPTGGKNTPSEALGLLYLWCLENGHIEEEHE